jgi:hypothetical protein
MELMRRISGAIFFRASRVPCANSKSMKRRERLGGGHRSRFFGEGRWLLPPRKKILRRMKSVSR